MGGGCFVKKSCGLIYFDYSDRVTCRERPFLVPDNAQKQAQVPTNRRLAKMARYTGSNEWGRKLEDVRYETHPFRQNISLVHEHVKQIR